MKGGNRALFHIFCTFFCISWSIFMKIYQSTFSNFFIYIFKNRIYIRIVIFMTSGSIARFTTFSHIYRYWHFVAFFWQFWSWEVPKYFLQLYCPWSWKWNFVAFVGQLLWWVIPEHFLQFFAHIPKNRIFFICCTIFVMKSTIALLLTFSHIYPKMKFLYIHSAIFMTSGIRVLFANFLHNPKMES